MENYEHDELRQENGYTPAQSGEPRNGWSENGQTYRGVGAGRKESPFADSPYVTHQEQNRYTYHHDQQSDTPPVMPETPPVKPPKEKKKHSGGKVWKRVVSVVLVLALVAGSCGVTALLVNQRWEAETARMTVNFNAKLDEMQLQIDAAAQAVGEVQNQAPITVIDGSDYSTAPGQVYASNVQSVVLITSEVTATLYGQNTTGLSSGSGFILTEDGYIITNNHVIEGANKVTITTHDGTEYPAEIVGSDATNDVAVLKAQVDVALPTVTIGSSTELAVGDQVVAIGNPLGELTSTLTVGYVSAKERDVTTDGRTINMIQTDAAINSGNSGGPLFNMKGEVVGITTAKYSGNSSSGATIEGIGFAIPIDDVIGMVEDLVNYGYITGAYLGVMVSDMNAEDAAYYGMPVGVYVQEVTPGYCAEAAGVRAKDIIVELGGYEVSNMSGLTRALRNFNAGDTTQIVVYRGGERISLTITLDEKPRDTATASPEMPDESGMPEDGSYEEWYKYFEPFFGNGND